MATLRDLRESILSLPADKVTEIHRQIRQSRRTPKRPYSKSAAKRKTVRRDLMAALENMPRSQLDRLIEELESRL